MEQFNNVTTAEDSVEIANIESSTNNESPTAEESAVATNNELSNAEEYEEAANNDSSKESSEAAKTTA